MSSFFGIFEKGGKVVLTKEEKMAEDVFFLSEDSTYQMLESFDKSQMVDQSLVYCFVKAFYLYAAQLYIKQHELNFHVENFYQEYKENLKKYYQTNNPEIENLVLDQVLNFFDNSYGLIGTVEISSIEDCYEFRHYVINVFELLRMILEKNSKANIRADLFDKDIRNMIEETEKIWDYIKSQEAK